jgi:glycosyltransferase 2 family protein
MKSKKAIQFVAGLLISAIFLFLVLRKVNLSEVLAAIKNAEYIYVIYAILLTILGLINRTFRWRYLLNQPRKISTYNLFVATCIGLMSNNILPFRLGDFVQAYFLGRKEKIGKTFIFSTVMLERLFDLVTLLAFFGLASLLVTVSGQIKGIKYVIWAVFLAIAGVILFLEYGKKTEVFFKKVVGYFSVPLAAKVSGWVDSFICGFQVIQHGKSLVKIILFSLSGWIINISVLWAVLAAFHIHQPFPVVTFVITIIMISVMIPSSPGFIGTWEYFGVLALGFFNIDKNLALSCILIHHMSQYFMISALGLFFLAKEGMSIKEVEHISETTG